MLALAGRAISPTLRAYATCYGLWAVVLGLCYASFWAWRNAVEALSQHYFRGSDAVALVYSLAMMVVGLVLFGAAVAAEGYLRAGVRQPAGRGRALGQRFGRIAAALLVATSLAVAAQEWVLRARGV
jgi:hypothetical protein